MAHAASRLLLAAFVCQVGFLAGQASANTDISSCSPWKDPTPYNNNTIEARDIFSGVLDTRQTCPPGSRMCLSTRRCCPSPSDACCDDGTCVVRSQHSCCARSGACLIGQVCCSGCAPSGSVCCSNSRYCDAGEQCCENGCGPSDAQCCRGGGYCPRGSSCVIYEGQRQCYTPGGNSPPPPSPDPPSPDPPSPDPPRPDPPSVRTYTQVIIWYYYYYYWIYLYVSINIQSTTTTRSRTSTRRTTSSTVTVSATASSDASSMFSSLSASVENSITDQATTPTSGTFLVQGGSTVEFTRTATGGPDPTISDPDPPVVPFPTGDPRGPELSGGDPLAMGGGVGWLLGALGVMPLMLAALL